MRTYHHDLATDAMPMRTIVIGENKGYSAKTWILFCYFLFFIVTLNSYHERSNLIVIFLTMELILPQRKHTEEYIKN